ncbi:MAG TPA: hypothetical protein VFQ05_06590 [Candidatus Eisenbacteria bacterium]|nr:hypothetical protein [Candidatus Eisenbacteria bacterium]
MSLLIGLAAFTLHCFPQMATDTPPAKPAVHQVVDQTPDEQRISLLAAAVYIARCAYVEALKTADPAATLDEMCDAVAEIVPNICKIVRTPADSTFAQTMRAAIADRLRAYSAIEYARIEAGDGYGYLFDLLAESLRKGTDPHVIRTTALDAPRRIRELAEQAGGDR